MSNTYQICNNCIKGHHRSVSTLMKRRCDYCNNYYSNIVTNWDTGEKGERELFKITEK